MRIAPIASSNARESSPMARALLTLSNGSPRLFTSIMSDSMPFLLSRFRCSLRNYNFTLALVNGSGPGWNQARRLQSLANPRNGRGQNQAWRLRSIGERGGFQCLCSVSAPAMEASESVTSQRKERVVSGVQPTGSVHLGNYLGAIKNWISLQDTYETLFFIVDLHAITLQYDAVELPKATRSTAAIYLACGVDIAKASVFVQSHVRAHVELMWLLSSVTPLGWLNKMIQFKEKSRKTVCYWR